MSPALAANAVRPVVTMTSTLSRTNSAAISARARCVPPPSDTRSRRCDPRSSRVRAAAAQKRRPMAPDRRRGAAEESDGRQLARLLRPRRERPRRRRAAEQRDELARRRGRVEDRRGGLGHVATLRFPSSLIKPDVPISGIRLSDQLHRKAHGGG